MFGRIKRKLIIIAEIPILERDILEFPKEMVEVSMEIYPLFPNEIPMEIQLLFPKRFILLPFPLIVLLV